MTDVDVAVPPLDGFLDDARRWFAARVEPVVGRAGAWGEGDDSVALFHNLSAEEERACIDANRAWIREKCDAGLAYVTWPREWGGRDLPPAYQRALDALEREFRTPPRHEAIAITTHLVAPTIVAFGTPEQQARHLRAALRTDEMWCQLFSEPGAGSDLAALSTRAVRRGDTWLVDGQKVWTSGAHFADHGLLLCRTDPAAPKHAGITAFLVPMRAPGVTVRPLRQLTGGSSFNEVFFDSVEIPDELRLGPVGAGWRVAVTTLGFERGATSDETHRGTVDRLLGLAEHLGVGGDRRVRQRLAQAYTAERLLHLNEGRVRASLRAGQVPGPEGSIGKLAWTEALRLWSDVASELLGPRLMADTGEWGTYAWVEHVLGAAGFRVAGGTDEVQRNILAERVLGLPNEPRPDRTDAWQDVPR